MVNDKLANKTLDDEFVVDGLWWLPKCHDNKVPGTLFFKGNAIELKLMGALQEDERFEDFFSESTNKSETIHGQSAYGEKLTLFESDSSFRGKTSGFTGYKSEVYAIDSFLVGGYFEDRNDISFYSSTIYPTYLTEWLDERPIYLNRNDPEKNFNIDSFTANFCKANTFKHLINSLEAEVEETYTFNIDFNNKRNKLYWEFTSGLSIIAGNNSFSWFESKNRELIGFLSILIGKGIYFNQIFFKGNYDETKSSESNIDSSRKTYSYFIKQHGYKNKNKIKNQMINFKEIDDYFPLLLDNWFRQNEELKEMYRLYLEIIYSDVVHLENDLLSTIQILEIYHRYKHKGNYSLKERLSQLLNSFSKNTILALIGDGKNPEKFVKQLRDTRNYLAHYDAKRKPYLLTSNDEKFYGFQRLKAIVTMILFTELGMDEEFVINKIKASQNFSYSLTKAKKILNG